VFRALCLAVALAMTPAGASAQAAAGQQLPAGWEFIEVNDWFLVDYNADSLFFLMAARQPMHIWVRTELKRADTSGTRSVRQMVQVDCSNWRRRELNSAFYQRNNLSGSVLLDDQPGEWTYPAPDTIGEIPLNILCE
jgi:hypothetical protein